MAQTLEFPALLRLIEERSVAFRAAVAAAPALDVQVPTCPEWVLLDLVQHLGNSHRRWAATVAIGPADGPPSEAAWRGTPPPAGDRNALLAWSAQCTEHLLNSLRDAGPDRGCWTWWDRSLSPQTSGGVARHQVQHVTVHTYDAQIAGGAAQPLPEDAALDGVEEFLHTSCAGSYPWPYDPATVDYHASEGRSWRLALSGAGVLATRLPPVETSGNAAGDLADASLTGTASELVLALYDRIPVDALTVDGDRRLFDVLREWDPDA